MGSRAALVCHPFPVHIQGKLCSTGSAEPDLPLSPFSLVSLFMMMASRNRLAVAALLAICAASAGHAQVTSLPASRWEIRAGDDAAWAAGGDGRGWMPLRSFGRWHRALPGHEGWVWYRTRIPAAAVRADEALAVRMPNVGGAYELFWNGRRIAVEGSLPPRFHESAGPRLVPVPPGAVALRRGADHLLAIRVFDDRATGGVMGTVRFGPAAVMMEREPHGELAIAVLVAIFATLGVYHLLFFFTVRHTTTENLWFALLSLSVALHGLGFAPALYQSVIPVSDRLRGLILAEVMAALSTAMLVRALFDLRFRVWEKAALAVYALAIPLVLFLPLRRVHLPHTVLDAAVLLGIAFLVGRIVAQARRNAPLARPLVGGVAVFAGTVIADLLAEYGVVRPLTLIPGVPGLFWFGFIGLLLVFGRTTAGHWAASEARASTDALTGLANRRVFSDTLARHLASLERSSLRLVLVLIDLDHFKQVNDRYGHVAGDEVLARVGQLLLHQAHLVDLAARIGGEELAVIVVDRSADEARGFAEQFRAALAAEQFRTPEGEPFQVTASLGIAEAVPGIDPTKLMQRADEALYEAKQRGRNQSVLAPPAA